MKKILILLLVIGGQIFLIGQTRYYKPSTNIIANPERGLQKFSITAEDYATSDSTNNLPISILNNWKNSSDSVTVIYRCFLLKNFIAADIDSTYLNNIQTDFNNIRTAGLKVIVRFAYYYPDKTVKPIPQQPSKSQILLHISQLSPILSNNKDVIFSIQAGFIGAWGEWYYTNSSEFGTKDSITDYQWKNRKEIMDALLAATPVKIPIQVRYVKIKKRLYGSSRLTDTTAYKNNTNARIGFYNDAFLNNWGDNGTYSVSDSCDNPIGTPDYNYLANETKYLPMTGEINGMNNCSGVDRTTGKNAVLEMDSTNWTTLNRDFDTTFWNQVIASGHYDEILKSLGYRLVLNSSTVTSKGKSFDLTLNITNVGYARPFQQRNVYLVMKDVITNNTTKYLIDTDIRKWENSFSINQSFDLGLTGKFKLYIWMPDKEASLQLRPDYSIKFANTGIWRSATGYNDLLQTINL